jgi:hypothetical protein
LLHLLPFLVFEIGSYILQELYILNEFFWNWFNSMGLGSLSLLHG